MDLTTIVSLIFGFLGVGGGLISLFTIKSQQRKAEAEAKKEDAEADSVLIENEGKKLNNMQEFAELWKKLSAEKSAIDSERIAALTERLGEIEKLAHSFELLAEGLQKEVRKLTRAITKAKECPGADKCPALLELNKND